ncbi:uncharacterized protein BJX67DRAFT_266026 [Aspergillus lucknowensis]|uniref:Uncharacterized protein n=1 Tax=Aspergillus lucknowensis TaxID=176173 RepID=A0ABR4LFH0_9EURO
MIPLHLLQDWDDQGRRLTTMNAERGLSSSTPRTGRFFVPLLKHARASALCSSLTRLSFTLNHRFSPAEDRDGPIRAPPRMGDFSHPWIPLRLQRDAAPWSASHDSRSGCGMRVSDSNRRVASEGCSCRHRPAPPGHLDGQESICSGVKVRPIKLPSRWPRKEANFRFFFSGLVCQRMRRRGRFAFSCRNAAGCRVKQLAAKL